MANENKDIGDIVKKCKILLLDIEGTTTSISFVKDKLFPYAEENVKQFLDSQWETADVKDAVSALRKLAIEDQEGSVEGVVPIPGEDASKEDQIEGLVKSVQWQMAGDRKAGALKQLQGLIWKQGYDNGDIKGHVYDDVSAALDAWHSAEGQKVYIYSSGSVQAQKLLFGQSLAGDLLKYIDGHFDTAVGAKQEVASYKNIVEKIGCQPEDILFLTDILKEAEAARGAGLHAALVAREGNAPLPDDTAFPVLRSLADLAVSNKRKPDPQEDTPAAKIPKTEEDAIPVAEIQSVSETVAAKPAEPEKMEVEETVAEEPKPAPVKEQVVVEEITDSNEGSSVASVIDIEPVVEETTEEKEIKTDKPKTEVKDVPMEEKKGDGDGPANAVPAADSDAPAAEKVLPAVVTEVEEVPEDKPMPDVAEIEDVVPIVEEPETEEMEELKNVGDVLEKECDEILSKVNSVTNLDSITVKPLLDPVPEETMETENTDSNDIVNRILDTELDLEMKQCDDIDPNTVTAMTDEKNEIISENGTKDIISSKRRMITHNEVRLKKENVDVTKNEMIENMDEAKASTEMIANKEKESADVSKPRELNTQNEVGKKNQESVDSVPESGKKDVDETKEAPQEAIVDAKNPESTDKKITAEVNSTDENSKSAKENTVEESNENIAKEVAKGEKEAEVKPAEKIAETESVVDEGKTVGEVEAPKESSEPHVNGKTNGDAKSVINGDAKKEELSARLGEEAVANGNGKVNGSNEDAVTGDCKVEEIKVKTVAEEVPSDPIEQPSEA